MRKDKINAVRDRLPEGTRKNGHRRLGPTLSWSLKYSLKLQDVTGAEGPRGAGRRVECDAPRRMVPGGHDPGEAPGMPSTRSQGHRDSCLLCGFFLVHVEVTDTFAKSVTQIHTYRKPSCILQLPGDTPRSIVTVFL